MRTIAILLTASLALGCSGPAEESDAAADGGADAGAALCGADSECDDGMFCNGAERCAPSDPAAGADGCVRPDASPCADGMICDEAGDACTCGEIDADGDGHAAIACGGDDCDDDDEARFAGNTEVCDAAGVDEDCDPDTIGPDADGDGHVRAMCCNEQPDGSLLCGTDCDDGNVNVAPGAPELCNGLDDDCSGALDFPGEDDDDDGFADCVDLPIALRDCNDGEATVYPGAPELCDGIDSDCDGTNGTFEDRDGDRHAPADAACEGGFPKDDCDDEEPFRAPGLPERCDGDDDDCDAAVDESCGMACDPSTEADWSSVASLLAAVDECTPECGDLVCGRRCVARRAAVGDACASCVEEYALCAAFTIVASCGDGATSGCIAAVCDACAQVAGDCSGLPVAECGACSATEAESIGRAALGAIARCPSSSCADSSCVEACARDDLDVGLVCADCVAAAYACQGTSCATPCAEPTSSACLTCMHAMCGPALATCSGATLEAPRCTEDENARLAPEVDGITACGRSCPDDECVDACTNADVEPDVSVTCSGCFAELRDCGGRSCLTECMSPGPSCDACLCDHCASELLTCTGGTTLSCP